jgi:tRNA-specific 2-thiouridylase
MKEGRGKKVYVGLSGGVDSSVSAYLLKKAGYDVTGVFIKVWQPDFVPCTWREDRLDAMRVAAKLNIPFKTLDLEKEYKEGVIDYLLAEYQKGRTPNPDVFCNKEVKFGAFYNWARNEGADFVATGHYVQISPQLELLKAKDAGKDQVYFLWTLTEDILAHTLFPVGRMLKSEVRKIAERANLVTATKKDSQGLCFVSNVDMKSFLKHFITTSEGLVLNEQGEDIGTHEGSVLYTLGERHGFTITKKTTLDKPYYVIAKDIEKNTITVSENPEEATSNTSHYKLSNLILRGNREKEITCEAQIRYHGDFYPAILNTENKTVTFKEPLLAPIGQSVVFYQGDICLGGAILEAGV